MDTDAAPRIYVGTSGFSFEDWRGPVYPESLPRAHWLIYYEQTLGFEALEINYTYYQMPSHRTLTGLLKKTTPAFRFTIKTHRSMTHDILRADRTIQDSPEAFDAFREGLSPLAESGRLGCVLAQFPYAFTNTLEHRDYLRTFMDRLADLNLVVEFRHQSWVEPRVYAQLRERGVGWCMVDEPRLPRLMPWIPEATSETAYARFHGRNGAAWFNKAAGDRYDYVYNHQELQELLYQLARLPASVKQQFLFFNNCHAGSAAKNAQKFKALLVEKGLLTPASIPQTLFPAFHS